MIHATLRMTRSIHSPRWAALLACSLAAACAGQDPAGNANGSGGASTGPGTGGAAPQAGADTQGGAGGADNSSTDLGGTSATPTGGRAAGGQSSGATGGSATGGAGVGGSTGCVDTCPFANGITWQCKKRFFYGLNQAWVNFAGDFGGGTRGVATNTSSVGSLFQNYSNNGASVIRWWVWPNFTGGGLPLLAIARPGSRAPRLLISKR